jgi:hypothetical protein
VREGAQDALSAVAKWARDMNDAVERLSKIRKEM